MLTVILALALAAPLDGRPCDEAGAADVPVTLEGQAGWLDWQETLRHANAGLATKDLHLCAREAPTGEGIELRVLVPSEGPLAVRLDVDGELRLEQELDARASPPASRPFIVGSTLEEVLALALRERLFLATSDERAPSRSPARLPPADLPGIGVPVAAALAAGGLYVVPSATLAALILFGRVFDGTYLAGDAALPVAEGAGARATGAALVALYLALPTVFGGLSALAALSTSWLFGDVRDAVGAGLGALSGLGASVTAGLVAALAFIGGSFAFRALAIATGNHVGDPSLVDYLPYSNGMRALAALASVPLWGLLGVTFGAPLGVLVVRWMSPHVDAQRSLGE